MLEKKKKVLIALDYQKKDFASIFSKIYNIAKDTQNWIEYKTKIFPTIKKVRKRDELKIITLDYMTEQLLKKKGIPFKSRSEITTNLLNIEIGKRTRDYVKTLTELFKKHDLSTIYNKMSLVEINEYEIWRSYLNRILYCIETAEEEIKKENPDEIILFNRNNVYQRAFAEVAKRKNIPVIDKTTFFEVFAKKAENFFIKLLGWSNVPKSLRNIEPTTEKLRKEKPVIIITHDNIGSSKIIPWAKLINRDKFDIAFIGVYPEDIHYKKNNISYALISKYGTREIRKKIKQKRIELKKALENLYNNKEFKKEYTYHGIPLWDLSDTLITFLYNSRFLYTVTMIELMREMMKREKPSAIITVDDLSRYGKTLLKVCKQENIPSIIVEHGWIIGENVFRPSIASKMLVYGEQTVKALMQTGVKESQIKVTGQCDGMLNENKRADREYVCKELGLDIMKPLVVFTSQRHFESFNKPLYETIYKIIQKFPDIQFVTKLHPDEESTEHEKFIKKYNLKNTKIVEKINLQKLIAGCDFLVNALSTVGIESLRIGTRVISVNPTNIPLVYYPKIVPNVSEMARTSSEFENILNNFLNDKIDREKEVIALGKYYIKNVGKDASKKIAEEIEKIIETHTENK